MSKKRREVEIRGWGRGVVVRRGWGGVVGRGVEGFFCICVFLL